MQSRRKCNDKAIYTICVVKFTLDKLFNIRNAALLYRLKFIRFLSGSIIHVSFDVNKVTSKHFFLT